MKRLTKEELIDRANKLYFSKGNIDEIYANEFGQFSYQKNSLQAQSNAEKAEVFLLSKKGIEAEKKASEKKDAPKASNEKK